MGTKRKQDEGEPNPDLTVTSKKPRKGFNIGPANLPDGTYRRKVQKIKKSLIHRANLQKSYAKIKKQLPTTTTTTSNPLPPHPPSSQIHPDRQANFQTLSQPLSPSPAQPPTPTPIPTLTPLSKPRRSRPDPFSKQEKAANQRRLESEARRAEMEEISRERERRMGERRKEQKVMDRARGRGGGGGGGQSAGRARGQSGNVLRNNEPKAPKRKLGLESKILLERVRRRMADG